MKVLSSKVSKCQSCNWSGEPQDSFCSVDKSHTVEQMFAYYDSEAPMGSKYSYHIRPDMAQSVSPLVYNKSNKQKERGSYELTKIKIPTSLVRLS